MAVISGRSASFCAPADFRLTTMCTLTFWPRRGGYLIGMNRDELLTREAGRAPAFEMAGLRMVLRPSEPGGGGWVGVNHLGICFALLNWNGIPAPRLSGAVSRGGVVAATLAAGAAEETSNLLAQLPLAAMRAFRLVGFFPAAEIIQEWRWNGLGLKALLRAWSPRQWQSSSFDELGAVRARGAVFARLSRDSDAGNSGWMRRLHACHEPHAGPYSICVHRPDAATVSYTEVEWEGNRGAVRHLSGHPCRGDLAALSGQDFLGTPEVALLA